MAFKMKGFKAHDMFDPKTGKKVVANTYDEHVELGKKEYTHEPPTKKRSKVKGGGTKKVCLPKAKVMSMSKAERAAVVRAKRSAAKGGKYKRSSKSFVKGARKRTPRARTLHINRALKLVALATKNLKLSSASGQGSNVIRFGVARAHGLAASVTSIVLGFQDPLLLVNIHRLAFGLQKQFDVIQR